MIFFFHNFFNFCYFKNEPCATFSMVTWPTPKIDLTWKIWKHMFSHLKTRDFRYQISENTCLDNRFCTGSGRTTDMKFIKILYGVVGPPVVGSDTPGDVTLSYPVIIKSMTHRFHKTCRPEVFSFHSTIFPFLPKFLYQKLEPEILVLLDKYSVVP